MTKPSNPDNLAAELAAARVLIEGHENMQLLLDLAADESDRRARAQDRAVQVAWRVAGGSAAFAFLCLAIAGGAVATALRPPPEPRVLVTDKVQGVIQPLISLSEYQMSPEEATIRRNVNTFVLGCEGYSYEQADIHYHTCAAFLSPQLQAQWVQKWDKANPDSPPNRYKNTSKIRIQVGAITILRNGLGAPIGARASFKKTVLVNDVPDGPATDWVANLSFHWVNQPTSEADRRINDLGFEVTDYTADRDLMQQPASQPMRQAAQQPGVDQMALVAPGHGQKVTP